ncbi:hypothetical protein PR048_001539 [Dryococelus australis]|uniref:Uncharacterized protein n=1 Tax=Dryococelus australis TaxID=614101 RepID=A0ABQ9IIN5_9NEOP|nr:hypothetical protein PR048_001539 [Dryococelus australis]
MMWETGHPDLEKAPMVQGVRPRKRPNAVMLYKAHHCQRKGQQYYCFPNPKTRIDNNPQRRGAAPYRKLSTRAGTAGFLGTIYQCRLTKGTPLVDQNHSALNIAKNRKASLGKAREADPEKRHIIDEQVDSMKRQCLVEPVGSPNNARVVLAPNKSG